MKPILGITMGDPSGNGPEITIKALMKPEIYERCRPVVIGDAVCMEAAASMVEGAYGFRIHAIRKVEDAVFAFGTIDVLDMGLVDVQKAVHEGLERNRGRSGRGGCEEGISGKP